jgi:hypothetical protein
MIIDMKHSSGVIRLVEDNYHYYHRNIILFIRFASLFGLLHLFIGFVIAFSADSSVPPA